MTETPSPIQVALVAPVQPSGTKSARESGRDVPDTGPSFALLAEKQEKSVPTDSSSPAAVDLGLAGLAVAAAVLQVPDIAAEPAPESGDLPATKAIAPEPKVLAPGDVEAPAPTTITPLAPAMPLFAGNAKSLLQQDEPPAAAVDEPLSDPHLPAMADGALLTTSEGPVDGAKPLVSLADRPAEGVASPKGSEPKVTLTPGQWHAAALAQPVADTVMAPSEAATDGSAPDKSAQPATPEPMVTPKSDRAFETPAASAFAELVARHGAAVRAVKPISQAGTPAQIEPTAIEAAQAAESKTVAVHIVKAEGQAPEVEVAKAKPAGGIAETPGGKELPPREQAADKSESKATSRTTTERGVMQEAADAGGRPQVPEVAVAQPVVETPSPVAPADAGQSAVAGLTGTASPRGPDAAGIAGQIRLTAAPPDLPIPQIARATIDSGPGVTEIRLSPEELGSIRMDLRTDGDRATLVVSAERPETLDLLRRHSDRLASEFRAAGFQDLDLGFGRWGGSEDRQAPSGGHYDPPAPSDEPRVDWPDLGPAVTASPLALRAGAGLYVRF